MNKENQINYEMGNKLIYSIKLNDGVLQNYQNNEFDETFFNKNKETLQNFTYFCINYCKSSKFLSKIIERIAYPTDSFQLSNNVPLEDELNLLIGFYAEDELLERISEEGKEKGYLFLEKNILENCKSIKESDFKLKDNELVVSENNSITDEDKEIMEDIFDCFKGVFNITTLQTAQ